MRTVEAVVAPQAHVSAPEHSSRYLELRHCFGKARLICGVLALPDSHVAWVEVETSYTAHVQMPLPLLTCRAPYPSIWDSNS